MHLTTAILRAITVGISKGKGDPDPDSSEGGGEHTGGIYISGD